MNTKYTCYHGTNSESAQNIIKTKVFKCSTGTKEWAGEGVYFFINWTEGEANASANALKWAKMRWSKKPHIPEVLKVEFEADADRIFDLTNPQMQEEFHKFRNKYFIDMKRRLRELGTPGSIPLTKIPDAGELDCKIINRICKSMDYCAVIKRCYINFEGTIKELRIKLPVSWGMKSGIIQETICRV